MVLNRINQFIDYKGIAVSAFEKSIGMSNASLGKSLKTGGTIGADKLGSILNTYPEINLYWLVTGEGEMLTADQPENPVEEKPEEVAAVERLLKIIESKEEEVKMLLTMLREKDARIDELRRELDARKGGDATAVAHSSSADAI